MRVVVLTGAGISAESGLQTFRAADGLWENHRIEEVATPEGFAANPAMVHAFYNARRCKLLEVLPNQAHLDLAAFEKRHNDDFLLVTQNIDDLHERAGSKNLRHMHGALLKMFCTHCGHKATIRDNLSTEISCQHCNRNGGMRPDIVWFGEMPYHMEEINAALSQCNLFVSVGTSGNVYPAAGFVQHARMAGAECVELNLEPSAGEHCFHRGVYGKATETLGAFFASLD